MQNFWSRLSNFLAKSLATLCAILFIITTPLALVLFNLDLRAFDPTVYEQALIEENIYQRLPGMIAETITSSAENNPSPSSDQSRDGPPQFINNLAPQQLETVITSLIPPDEMKQMSEQALSQIFAYLNGQNDTAALSLTSFKQRLTGEAGVQAILDIIAAQPACTMEQLLSLTAAALSNPKDLPLCSLPKEALPLVKPLLQATLRSAAVGIPNQVILISSRTSGTAASNNLQRNFRLARIIMRWSPLLPLLCLLGITIFTVRSLIGWLRWWGIPLLLAGGLGASLAWGSLPVFGLTFTNFLAKKFPPSLPDLVASTILDLLRTVLQNLVKPIGLEALALAGIGLVMVVAAALLRSGLSPQAES